MNKDDPNAALFAADEEESEEEMIYNQTYGKNPKRADLLMDLIYKDMIDALDRQNLPEEAKRQMIFKMTASSLLDMIMDSSELEDGLEVSYSLDMFMGVAHTNVRYNVDLFKEHEKAMLTVKPSDFDSEEAYENALQEFEEKWWYVPQPLLEKRHPNDAIMESLKKYGLTD